MSTGKIVLGVLAGITAGAALGILFAPDKGTATRKKIARKSGDYAQGISDQFNTVISQISKSFESLRDEVVNMTEQGLEHAEKIVMDTPSVDHVKMNRQKEYSGQASKS